jgi:Na+/proline symporter
MSPIEFIADGLIPLLGMALSFVMIIAIVVIVTRARQRKLELQAELQGKLIDKFGSSAELVSFLQSDLGQRFVNNVQTGHVKVARDKAATAVRIGIIFTALGVAFLTLWPITNTRGLAWPGVILLVLGFAYFATSYTTLHFADSPEKPVPPTSIES